MKIVLIMIALISQMWAYTIEPDFIKNGDYMGIKILDSKVLESSRVYGLKFCEISDIVYDEGSDILYALSDKGRMFKCHITIKEGKITDFKLLSAQALRGEDGRKFFGKMRDSEGMALKGKHLYISFERKPRIIKYSKKMNFRKSLKLPKPLRKIKHYQGENRALEALCYDKKRGFITAAEYPLKSQKGGYGYHDIYNLDGVLCRIKRQKGVGITELESMSDGNLLMLQRKFALRSFSFETTLSKIYLDEVKDGECRMDILAWMSSKQGWKIDNFEGLTRYHDTYYLMISDDNNNPLEKTILTLFELKEKR